MIAWDDRGTEILVNPRLTADDRTHVLRLIAAVPPLDAHVWLTTSGATGRLKPVALSKQALLVSARAVNEHLASDAHDVWLNVLPPFHVGGLGIHARAHLSGARVVSLERWDVAAFGARLTADAVTLTSLVPTQVFDLVQAARHAPPSLRAVVVGGGALDPELWRRARALRWPLLPSYGATECASQIATAAPSGAMDEDPPPLRLLPHVQVRTAADGRLEVHSDALFTGYATASGLDDPKREGWWRTNDLGGVQGDTFTVHGRADEMLKVGGELVHLAALETRLAEIIAAVAPGTDAALVRVADPRLEWVVGLAVATADSDTATRVRDAYNAAVLPFERARVAHRVASVPRTALGKVARGALEEVFRNRPPA